MINIPELRQHKTTIKRGHYGLVDASAKLKILGELVNRALETAIFREKLDEIIESINPYMKWNRKSKIYGTKLALREETPNLPTYFTLSKGHLL